jgi:hypothetical protein
MLQSGWGLNRKTGTFSLQQSAVRFGVTTGRMKDFAGQSCTQRTYNGVPIGSAMALPSTKYTA